MLTKFSLSWLDLVIQVSTPLVVGTAHAATTPDQGGNCNDKDLPWENLSTTLSILITEYDLVNTRKYGHKTHLPSITLWTVGTAYAANTPNKV